MEPYCSADEYYPMLCRFFDWVEAELDLNVVIAAHPKSHYEDHPDWYGGRRVVKDETVQLVRGSQLVMTFFSTAIGFGVVYRKPIILLTNDRFQALKLARIDTESLARPLGKTPLNLSDGLGQNLDEYLVVNDGRYEEYQRAYMKGPGTPESPFWQVVADRVRTIGV